MKIVRVIVSITLLLVVGAGLYAWYSTPKQQLTPQFSVVPPIPEAAKVQTVEVPLRTVVVYQKAELQKKISLPAEIAQDASKQVTATADLPASRAGTEVISVIDTDTGVTTLQARAKELPLFGFENEKRIGVGYSMGIKGERGINVYGEWTVARVGNVYGGVRAEASSRGDTKATAQIEYRFGGL